MEDSKKKKPKGKSDYFGILRIPIPRPGTDHKSEKDYDRKKSKTEIKKIIKDDSEI